MEEKLKKAKNVVQSEAEHVKDEAQAEAMKARTFVEVHRDELINAGSLALFMTASAVVSALVTRSGYRIQTAESYSDGTQEFLTVHFKNRKNQTLKLRPPVL